VVERCRLGRGGRPIREGEVISDYQHAGARVTVPLFVFSALRHGSVTHRLPTVPTPSSRAESQHPRGPIAGDHRQVR
jgi:hypothetical protein